MIVETDHIQEKIDDNMNEIMAGPPLISLSREFTEGHNSNVEVLTTTYAYPRALVDRVRQRGETEQF